MSKNSDMHDDVIYTWYDLESDRLYLKRNGIREEVPPITRDYIRDLNDQMNALREYATKLEQTNIVLDSDNTELLNDMRDMQMIVSDNAKLRQQLADVTESMGRVEERCAKLREYAKLMHGHIKKCCDACGERGICDVDALARSLGIEVPE